MAQTLQTDLVLNSVGQEIRNYKNEFIGCVTEVFRDRNSNQLQYLVLKSEAFAGRGERYFAVPVSSSLIKIQESGNIILAAEKDDLEFAQGISIKNCPKPDYRFSPTIYELYEYNKPLKDDHWLNNHS